MSEVVEAALVQGTNAAADAAALESLSNKYTDRATKKPKLSKEQILAKHFNPRQDTEIFRGLPKRDGEEIIEEGYFHKVQAGQFAKNTITIYCPAKNSPKVQRKDENDQLVFDQEGKPVMVEQYCPSCAKAKAIRAKMDKTAPKKDDLKTATPEQQAKYNKNIELLKRSNLFEAKLYYIIRGIDRGAEKDGVKFWRFKHNFKNQGVHDKLWKPVIMGYYKQTGKLYSDVNEGIDLVISVTDNTSPNGVTYRDVSGINPRMSGKSPLHTDALILKQWLEDKTTWRDVFKPKKAPGVTETEFLKLACEEREVGQKFDMRNTPYYNEQTKKWVFPNHPDLETKANTRTQNLDADSDESMDYEPEEETSNYAKAAVDTVANANAPDITEMSKTVQTSTSSDLGSVNVAPKGSYDDLPF